MKQTEEKMTENRVRKGPLSVYRFVLLCFCVFLISTGCVSNSASRETSKNPLVADNNGLGETVGSVAEVFAFDAVDRLFAKEVHG